MTEKIPYDPKELGAEIERIISMIPGVEFPRAREIALENLRMMDENENTAAGALLDLVEAAEANGEWINGAFYRHGMPDPRLQKAIIEARVVLCNQGSSR